MPIILFGIIMILGDDFMINLSIPSDTLGLFNFKQYVKNSKILLNIPSLIITTVSLIYMIKVNLEMFLLITFKRLSFVLLSILVTISLSVLTVAKKLLLLIPAVPDTVPNVVLNPVKDMLLMSALWLHHHIIFTIPA